VPFEADFVRKLGYVLRAFRRRRFPISGEPVLGRLRSELEAAALWNLHELARQALSHEGYAKGPARQFTADRAALLEVPLMSIVYPGSFVNRPTVHGHVT
jgi:hypothetical protein